MAMEMAGLGFKRIELSHGIRISLVPGIFQAVEEGLVEISSIHNFCPLPSGVQHAAPNLYQPSAGDPREVKLWKKYTEQTLEFAVKVGAKRVVMHSGSVWFFFRSPEARLERWLEKAELEGKDLREHDEFKRRRDRALNRIRRSARRPKERIKEHFESILGKAAKKGLQLGIENREGLEELPLEEEHADFVRGFETAEAVGYWHDTGHAELKARMGLLDHEKRLEELADRLVGFHLHDVSAEGRDHQVPGTGVIDFGMVARYVKPEHALVLELSPVLSADEVRASRDFVLGVCR